MGIVYNNSNAAILQCPNKNTITNTSKYNLHDVCPRIHTDDEKAFLIEFIKTEFHHDSEYTDILKSKISKYGITSDFVADTFDATHAVKTIFDMLMHEIRFRDNTIAKLLSEKCKIVEKVIDNEAKLHSAQEQNIKKLLDENSSLLEKTNKQNDEIESLKKKISDLVNSDYYQPAMFDNVKKINDIEMYHYLDKNLNKKSIAPDTPIGF